MTDTNPNPLVSGLELSDPNPVVSGLELSRVPGIFKFDTVLALTTIENESHPIREQEG